MLNKIKKLFEFRDLTTERKPLLDLIYFCIPLLLTTFLTYGINLINSMVLKETVGGNSVTAMNQTGSLQQIIFNFSYGCTSGFAVIVGNKFGAKDKEGLGKSIISSISLCFVLWIFTIVVGLITLDPLLEALNVDQLYYQKAHDFFSIELAFFLIFVLSNLGGHVLRAMGNSFIPLVTSLATTVAHVLFVFALTSPNAANLDVVGCAIANILTNGISIFVSFYFIFSNKDKVKFTKESFVPDKAMYLDMLKMGLPLGFQWSILFIGSFVQTSQTNLYGTEASKAMTVYSNWEGYLNIAVSVMATGLLSFVSQNYGAKKYKRVKEGIKDAFIAELFIYGATLIVGFSTLRHISSLFLPVEDINDKVQFYVTSYLSVLVPFTICQGIINISRSTLQGIKRPIIPLLSGIGELGARIGISLGLPWLIDNAYQSTLSNSSFMGICFSTPAAWVMSVLIMGTSVLFLVIKNPLYKQNEEN